MSDKIDSNTKISGSGRSTIDSSSRKNSSKRAQKGRLFIEKHKCLFCGHHKKFRTMPTTIGQRELHKCCRCKKEVLHNE